MKPPIFKAVASGFRPYQLALAMLIIVPCYSDFKFCAAQTPVSRLPGLAEEKRSETLLSPADFFGFAIGSRHLRHDQVTAYFQYLAANSDRAKLIDYGVTAGGRPLFMLAISSAEHIADLTAIQKRRRQLTSGTLKSVPTDSMLVMFMGYCVHGDEASAVNAAPIVAYDLISGISEASVARLDQALFFVDPALNPDGVDRFANWVNENRGRFASDNPADREHQAPWPGGRTSYYWFDLNRDWLPLSHPESQGRMRLFHQWKPNVVLDFHEMGPTNTYFFQPGVPTRNNPLTPADNLRLTRQFASDLASAMDRAGELYFSEEVFDDFYIGKGSTYPDLNGAIGILFEQGSTAGLKLKTNRTERQFADTVANQVRSSRVSVAKMIELKPQLLDFQHDFYKKALQSGKESATRAYVLTGTASRIRAAATLLKQHQIRGHVNQQPIQLEGKPYLAGNALVIPTAQAQYVLLESLMQTPQQFPENVFYDVSAWHLPSAFDLDMHPMTSDLPEHWIVNHSEQTSAELESTTENLDGVIGVAFSPVELEAPQWVAALMKMGAEVRVSMSPFSESDGLAESAGTGENTSERNPELPAGTFLVLKSGNETQWNSILRRIQIWKKRDRISAQWITSGINPQGPDLGSSRIVILPKCNPALIVGDGTNANSAGAIWHFLDHRIQQPLTLLEANQIVNQDLKDYSCLLLPAGAYPNWGPRESAALRDYARQGGTIIATGSAIGWLNETELIKLSARSKLEGGVTRSTDDGIKISNSGNQIETRRAELARDVESSTTSANSAVPGSVKPIRFADAQNASALETIAGAFFMVRIDPTHPLAFGFPDEWVPVFRDSTAKVEGPANPLQVAATYEQVIAGYVSQNNRERLLGSTAVWATNLGKGRIIMMEDLPVFRGYVRSSERFLTNAILLGPILEIPSMPSSDE